MYILSGPIILTLFLPFNIHKPKLTPHDSPNDQQYVTLIFLAFSFQTQATHTQSLLFLPRKLKLTLQTGDHINIQKGRFHTLHRPHQDDTFTNTNFLDVPIYIQYKW